MPILRSLLTNLLVFFILLAPQTSYAQSVSAPNGWQALLHWYSGPNYAGAFALSRYPASSSNYSSPPAACAAVLNILNVAEPDQNYTMAEMPSAPENGLTYPIFSYGLQKWVAVGYHNGYKCQLVSGQTGSGVPNITQFGWRADVAVLIVPACPIGMESGYFEGAVVCGAPATSNKITKPNTCPAGGGPLTAPIPVTVGNPVSIDNGEKVEREQDYATADGLLVIDRSYRSGQRSAVSTTEAPGFGKNWRGLLPGRLLARGEVSGGEIYSFTVEYQAADGNHERFTHSGWDFSPFDITRLKLGRAFAPTGTPVAYFQGDIAAVNAAGEFKLSFPNGDYILFSRAGALNPASRTRALVPVERGFANGYKIWFDYPENEQHPNKLRDSLNREMSLSWTDLGWSSPTIADLKKEPSPTPPSNDAILEKAIGAVLLPDNTSINYSYGVSDSSGFKSRLENVTRKNNAGDVLWARTYQYTDPRFPQAITGKADQNGNQLSTYTYDENGRAISTERAVGFDRQTISYGEERVVPDPNGGDVIGVTEQSVTNPLGRKTRYKFITGQSDGESGTIPLDTPARLVSVVGQATPNLPQDVSETQYVDGQVTGNKDANGNATTQTVDPVNKRPTTVTDAKGVATQITWHPTLDLPTRTVRKRLQTDYSYDANGQLTGISETDLGTNETRGTQFTMAAAGRVTAINGPRAPDAQGRDDVTSMTYDAQGNRLTMTNALGHVTRYEGYDPNGRAARMIDPNGAITEFTYDALGRVKAIDAKHPADATKDAITAMDYDVEGRVIAITRPDTARINFDYNLAGLMTAIRSDDGERIDYGYDPMGNRTSETVKRADGTQFSSIARTFDEIGRMLTETFGPGRTHGYEYDKVGNAVRVYTARGAIYENSFDSLNRLVQTLTPDEALFTNYYDGSTQPIGGAVVSPGSSAQNELGVFEDAHGTKTRFTRNAFGQVTQEVSPDRGTTLYEYDAAGDVKAMVDGRGQRVEYARDILGRVLTKTPIGRPATEKVTYTYDTPAVTGSFAIGRLSRIDDGTGATRVAYDHRGNMVTRFQKLVGTPDWVALRYGYDLADRIETVTYPSGRQARYVRDAKGRVVGVRTRANSTALEWTTLASNISYEAFGPLRTISYGNGERMIVTRGDDGRLDGRRLYRLGDSSNISHLTYAYDADDNMTRITDRLDASKTLSFAYDPVGRMKRVTAASGDMQRTDYVFDGNGNRFKTLTRPLPTDPPEAATTETYQVPFRTNRLDAITGPNGTRSFSYDARGNLIAETRPGGITVSAAYDGYGRLTNYTRTGEANLAHVYNGMDERVASSSGTDTRRFLYAPDGRVLGEYGANAQDVKAEFIWLSPQVGDAGQFGGDDGLGGYMPLAVAANDNQGVSQLSWVHASHMGVPIRYSDASGNTLAAPTTYSVPGFPGQSRTLADLYYNKYRDYDTSTGRYIQADPIGLAGGPSPYSYAMNSPLRYSDPTGETPVHAAILIGMGLGAGSELAIQAGSNWWNDRDVGDASCYDWGEVAISGGFGAVGGGAGRIIGGGLRYGARTLTRETGLEWSHWISRARVDRNTSGWLNQMLNTRGGLNGRWVTPQQHFRHDVFRYPAGWKQMPDRFRYDWQRSLDRTPAWIRGMGGGTTAGIGIGEADGQ
jgi:RHS repeat-associated protein